jgi:hypothetical protein
MTGPAVEEHAQIAVGIATAIAHQISEAMPAIQAQLQQGVDRHGFMAQVTFRYGNPQFGETPVVADLEFSVGTGERQLFRLQPDQATGNLAIEQPIAAPPGMNGGEQYAPSPNQYPPQQQHVSQPPPPMMPRQELPPPNAGQQLTAPPLSAVSGPIPQNTQPPQQQAQPQYIPNPQYQQAQHYQPPPAPLPPTGPVRLRRPPLADEGGVR